MLAIRRCKAVDIEFPVLIAAAAKPIDAVVVPLISKARCNTVLTQSPDLFDQPVVAFVVPFAGQESDDSLTAHQKFSPVSPIAPLRGDLTLHHHLGLKTLEVAKDRGDSHYPSAALEAE
jgi:hypothetical protein